MLDSLNVYGAIFFLSTFPCRFSKWNVWSTLSSCSTFQQHVNNYGCGRVNLHRQSKAAAGGGTHGAVRHLKHPPNCICRLVVKYLPLSCLIIAADSSDRGRKRSAAFELPLTSLSPYRLLSSTHDLALYIWQIYKPHTASKTGTPRLKGFVFFKEDSQCRKSTWCSSVVKSRIELGRSRSLQRCSLSPLKNPLWREAEVVFMELERYVCSSCVCVETGGPKRLRVDAEGARLENTVRFLTQLSEVSCVHTERTVTVCKRPTWSFITWRWKACRFVSLPLSSSVHVMCSNKRTPLIRWFTLGEAASKHK